MEDGNELFQTMGTNTTFHYVDGYMDIEIEDDKTSTTAGTEVSTFTTETLSLADKKLVDILSKNHDSISPDLLEYLQKTGILSQGGRGEMSSPVKKGSSLNKRIVRKHGKIKKLYHIRLKY